MQRVIRNTVPTVAKVTERVRVAAYARVSTGKDAMLHSLAAQVDHYRKYIQQRPEWEFAGVYADEAASGTTGKRPAFQRLLADCRAGCIDLVITKSISRFARNTVDLLAAVRKLKAWGIDVYFEEQAIHSIGADGEFLMTLMSSVAEAESLSCSENCKWRIRRNYELYIPNALRIYGYDFIDKELVVNPTEAPIVRMIYADFLAGMGKTAIQRKLMKMHVPAKNGGNWSPSVIDGILRNEKYIGTMILQKTYLPDHLSKKVRINTGQLPLYRIRNNHPAIVDPETFDAVQAERVRRTSTFKKPETLRMTEFTGKIHCGICGAHFRRKTTPSQKVWCCPTFNFRGKEYCSSKQIPEEILKEEAMHALRLEHYSATVFAEQISEIRVPQNGVLEFVFLDGRVVSRTWENRSRRERWTPEMREAARQRAKKGRCRQ